MTKKVISIISNLNNQDEQSLLATYQFFADKDYEIEQFIDDDNQLQVDQLPALIDQVRSNGQGISRIVLISNIRPLLLSWYRCYNTLVDDFVLFVNDDECDRTFHNQLDIVTFLSNFNDKSLAEENLLGEIYYNNLNLESGFGKFILTNGKYHYFDQLSNFQETQKRLEVTQKSYIFQGNDYFFMIAGNYIKDTIRLSEEVSSPYLDISEELMNYVQNNHQLMIHLFLVISNLDQERQKKYQNLNNLMELFSKFEQGKQIDFYNDFKTYIKRNNVTFIEKMSFFNVLVKLEGTKYCILQDMMNEIKNDEKHIEYHYPLVTNSLFFVSKERVQKYPNVINDRMEILDRIVDYYDPLVKKVQKSSKKKIEKIAVITSQLISIKHSPTLLALTIAKYLKKLDSDLEITIFVDDTYIYCEEEMVFPNMYSSVPSQKIKLEHKDFINGIDGIEINYPNQIYNRKIRIQNEVNEVLNINPDVIYLMGADFSLRTWALAKHIPTVVMGISPEPSSFKYGEVYTAMHNEKDYRTNESNYRLPKRKYETVVHRNSLPKPTKIIKRKDLKIKEEDFVIVTAGNRLVGDVNEQFLDIIKKFLNVDSKIKWLLIGNASHSLVNKYLINEINNNQILFRGYEEDLQAVLKICDLYVNPFCIGNGRIGRMAISSGLPIVSFKGSSDISSLIGDKHTVYKQDYFEYMLKLFSDKDLRLFIAKELKNQEMKYSPENWSTKIINVFNSILIR
jgi:hypothetical protein